MLQTARLFRVPPLVPLVLSQRLLRVGHGGEEVKEGHAQHSAPEIRWAFHQEVGSQQTPGTHPLQAHVASSGQASCEQVVQACIPVLHLGNRLSPALFRYNSSHRRSLHSRLQQGCESSGQLPPLPTLLPQEVANRSLVWCNFCQVTVSHLLGSKRL